MEFDRTVVSFFKKECGHKMKTIFLTAGLGADNFKLAAKRLTSQVSDLNLFDEIVVVDEISLRSICPTLFTWYTSEELRKTTGYGYFVWQPALLNAALEGYWGDFDLMVYMDAGCEVLPGFRSRRIFRRLLTKASDKGCVAFAIDTPELQYSKAEVISLLPEIPRDRLKNQIQAGTLFISRDKGKLLVNKWNEITQSDKKLTNDELGEQRFDFIAHRHSQSIFSIVFKLFDFYEEDVVIPFPRNSFFSKFKAARFPIWWARNRTGETAVPRILQIFHRVLI